VAAARRLAETLGATVLLKGNVTVIAEHDPTNPGSLRSCPPAPDPGSLRSCPPARPAYLNPAGGSWAATAGSGDVLSGIVGALLAAGLPAAQAAAAAAFVHARAANASAADPGPAPVPTSASRILSHIRSALANL
jgi:NAD(P)H-hydrate repair Nnr-like enzyme with NAD(P)H-hydrate dehydratase domain